MKTYFTMTPAARSSRLTKLTATTATMKYSLGDAVVHSYGQIFGRRLAYVAGRHDSKVVVVILVFQD
jgi:hypothetical protein